MESMNFYMFKTFVEQGLKLRTTSPDAAGNIVDAVGRATTTDCNCGVNSNHV
jgi:hypothetical protein